MDDLAQLLFGSSSIITKENKGFGRLVFRYVLTILRTVTEEVKKQKYTKPVSYEIRKGFGEIFI